MASISDTNLTSRVEAPPITGSASGTHSRGTIAGFAAVALVVAVIPYFVNERFTYHVAIMVCLAAIGSCSLHLIIRTGHVSLCHSAFIGVGAYVSASVVMRLGLPFVAGAAAGTFASGALALLIGPVILRLTGKYFVLITFLFGEIMRMIFTDWISLTGGANGLDGIPPPAPYLADPKHFYILALGCAVVSIGICGRMLSSEIGRVINAMRDAEQLTECVGVPVIRTKVLIFVIACALAGFSGSLMAHYAHYISPLAFGPIESLNLVIMNVIGGMNTLVGPLIGALFLVLVPELLRGYVEFQHIIFGILLVVVMAFMPGGIAELRDALRRLHGTAK